MRAWLCGLLAASVATGWLGRPISLRAEAQSPAIRVVFTRSNNVAMMNLDGGNVSAVTTRGTAPNAATPITYRSYAWSPDGKYLLLVKDVGGRSSPGTLTLFLLDRQGHVIRTLATGLPDSVDFYPGWAMDTDQIAFIARQQQASNRPHNVVQRVDVAGHRAAAWTYNSQGEGCGGGTGIPAEAALWAETGFGDRLPTLQWSLGGNLAVYSPSCAGGIAVTNLRTGRTRDFGIGTGYTWTEGALAPSGRLAVSVRTNSPTSTTASSRIVLVNPYSGKVTVQVGTGEHPHWTAGGRTLVYVLRKPDRILHMTDRNGNHLDDTVYATSIWQADANGTHPRRLVTMDAYGTGVPTATADGRTLVFSRVDNDWKLWQHRGPRNVVSTVAANNPMVRIQRLDLPSGKLRTLQSNAGRPAVQP